MSILSSCLHRLNIPQSLLESELNSLPAEQKDALIVSSPANGQCQTRLALPSEIPTSSPWHPSLFILYKVHRSSTSVPVSAILKKLDAETVCQALGRLDGRVCYDGDRRNLLLDPRHTQHRFAWRPLAVALKEAEEGPLPPILKQFRADHDPRYTITPGLVYAVSVFLEYSISVSSGHLVHSKSVAPALTSVMDTLLRETLSCDHVAVLPLLEDARSRFDLSDLTWEMILSYNESRHRPLQFNSREYICRRTRDPSAVRTLIQEKLRVHAVEGVPVSKILEIGVDAASILREMKDQDAVVTLTDRYRQQRVYAVHTSPEAIYFDPLFREAWTEGRQRYRRTAVEIQRALHEHHEQNFLTPDAWHRMQTLMTSSLTTSRASTEATPLAKPRRRRTLAVMKAVKKGSKRGPSSLPKPTKRAAAKPMTSIATSASAPSSATLEPGRIRAQRK